MGPAARLRLPFAAAALALLALTPLAAGSNRGPGAKPSRHEVVRRHAANLLPNGSFETSTSGWASSTASLALVADGVVGSRAVRVAGSTSATTYTITAVPRTVASTAAGRAYAAGAWVRSDRPGKTVCVRLREWSGSGVVAYASSCAATTGTWRRLPALAYTAKASGDQLDLFLYQGSAVSGDSFELDGATLDDGATAPPPPTTTTTTTTTTPLPSATAQTWLSPFASTTTWQTPLPASPALDPGSAAKVSYFVQNAVHNPNFAIHGWTTTIAVAAPDSPRYTVPCTVYKCTLGALGSIPIPRGTLPDPQGDGHLAVWDPVTHVEWDFWQPTYDAAADRWTASAGAAASTDGDGLAPAGTAGADAADIPLLAGLVRPEEIAAGHIDHALMFAMPGVATGAPKCPATHSAGSNTSPYALTEGTRLQLDPSLDVSALAVPAWEKTILRALQRYGMFLRDQGGALTILGENPLNRGYDAWAQVGVTTSGGSIALKGVPWDRLRVIDAPSC
jgi:hypothetical protein